MRVKIRFFRLKYLIIMMIAATILYVAIHPDYLYTQKNYFNQEIETLFDVISIIQLKNNSNFDILALRAQPTCTWVYFINHSSKKMNQTEFPVLTKSKIRQYEDLLFYDEDLQNVNFINYPDEKSYAIMTISDDEALSTSNSKFYEHKSYEELQKDSLFIGENCFYNYEIRDDIVGFTLEKYKKGYRYVFAEDYLTQLRIMEPEQSEIRLKEISDKAFKNFKIELSTASLRKILQSTNRYNYFQNRLFYNTGLDKYGFSQAEILGKIDCNNDGEKDFLILILGMRYFNTRLISIDGNSKEIIWDKEFTGTILNRDICIADIDNDSVEEIMISFYSPCYEMPIDHDSTKIFGSTRAGKFLVLENSGNIKEINNKPAAVESIQGFYDYQFSYCKNSNKVLLGLTSHYKTDRKQLLSFDLNSNSIDTLGIDYINIIDIRKEGEGFSVFSIDNNILHKLVLNQEFELIAEHEQELLYDAKQIYNNSVVINNIEYYLLYNREGSLLIDHDLERSHSIPHEIVREPIQIGDILYVVTRNGTAERLKRLKILRNKEINLYLLIIMLAEFLLLTAYLLILQLLKLPLSSPQKNYFIMYSLLGKLHYCSLRGKITKNYELPQKITRKREEAEHIMAEISDKTRLIFIKNLFLLKLFVYEIRIQDELEIIRRLSHDLKNSLLLQKLLTDEYFDQIGSIEYLEKYENLNRDISAVAQTLSNFSHIDKLYLEWLDINQLLRDLVFEYNSHRYFQNIELNLPSDPVMINIDRSLCLIAFKNLLNNALEEITPAQKIVLSLDGYTDTVLITLENPVNQSYQDPAELIHIGFSTKTNGSGIGLPIARVIIERHNGDLRYKLSEGNFIVEIILNP